MKIALVHDHLNQLGGAEKVLLALHEIYPNAPIYTITYDKLAMGKSFESLDIRTSFIQRMPFGIKHYKWFLPFMPAAFEQFDFSNYDVVISSSSAYSKGIITKPETLHICFCHTPTRYLWNDHFDYIRTIRGPKFIKKFVQLFSTYLRIWDKLSADRVNKFIANSSYVKQRIGKYYQRNADVIYPPVETSQFSLSTPKDYYLIVSRLRPYKKVDLAVAAFNKLGLPLKIIGGGEEERRLKEMAKPNIEFLGIIDDEQKRIYVSQCKAFINPQEEDFGIAAVEAMAAGRPVIAYAKGGAIESVVSGVTGIFFTEQTAQSLISAVEEFEQKQQQFDPQKIQQHARKFDTELFKKHIKEYVDIAILEHKDAYENRIAADIRKNPSPFFNQV